MRHFERLSRCAAVLAVAAGLSAAPAADATHDETASRTFIGNPGIPIAISVCSGSGTLYGPGGTVINGMQFYAPSGCDFAYCTAMDQGVYTLRHTPGASTRVFSPPSERQLPAGLEPVDVVLSTAVFALNAGMCLSF